MNLYKKAASCKRRLFLAAILNKRNYYVINRNLNGMNMSKITLVSCFSQQAHVASQTAHFIINKEAVTRTDNSLFD